MSGKCDGTSLGSGKGGDNHQILLESSGRNSQPPALARNDKILLETRLGETWARRGVPLRWAASLLPALALNELAACT
jgi:hypothetical protein